MLRGVQEFEEKGLEKEKTKIMKENELGRDWKEKIKIKKRSVI